MFARDPLFIEKYLGWINAATPDDVRTAARTWLTRGWHQVNVMPAGKYTAAAQGVDRSAGLPPIPTDMPTLSFPRVQTATLSNGVRVVLAERHTLPIVELSMQFDAGYAADAGGKLGAASFAMSMLDTGTTTRSALEISAESERLGAVIGAGSNLDASVVTLSALKTNLAASVALWADLIRNPVFAAQEVDRLKGRWVANIAQEKAQPTVPRPATAASACCTAPATPTRCRSPARVRRRRSAASRATTSSHSSARGCVPTTPRIFIVGDTTLPKSRRCSSAASRGLGGARHARARPRTSPPWRCRRLLA